MAEKSERVGLLNRTVQNLRYVWRDVAERTSGIFSAAPAPGLPDKDLEPLRTQLRDCLEGRGGEVSARSRAANLGGTYLSLNTQGRRRFLKVLAQDFDVDHAAVDQAVAALHDQDMAAVERLAAEQSLRQALRPARVKLLTQFNGLPEGIHFLVNLREELLLFCRKDSDLAALERDLKNLLVSWFDVGFLELRRITWSSPASLLEKLIEYEAVHAIESWDNLKKRLDTDRRCFAFFHPRMPDEPLIFVEVALVNGMATSIQALLNEDAPVIDPNTADTAIFYSISNTQAGLSGISFGNFLIKRVVDLLTAEFKGLKAFATLSPIPGFRNWLDKQWDTPLEEDGEPAFLTPAERKALAGLPVTSGEYGKFQTLLELPNWHDNPQFVKALKYPLTRLCAQYLVEEKRPGNCARDRVAHFHLSNGARVERVNWLANTSPEGLAQALGLMVNYRYKLADIEANHEAYTGEGRVCTSAGVRSLLRV
ncbi:MAG: malonyl-CoA decarboxylase [Candidatus Competibacteraceae bacterium]|jgi:malonyl-CoA decarboxylase|nr:malonyl-CoA decarboxylase [Candidatus Competibacteraceae bacterium]